jgi:hypothetical protein
LRALVASPEVAAYAADIARAFGSPVTFGAPGDERGWQLLRARLEAVLHDVRPHPDGPSLGEALRPLIDDARRGLLAKARSTKMIAELQSLFVQAVFRRTKRAERGRLFAQFVVVFGLEGALGVESNAGEGGADGNAEGDGAQRDAEAHLRRVRRALRDS